MNDSFGRSVQQDAENEAFAKEVQRIMEEDDKITAGFIDIYKNATGNYHWLALGCVSCTFIFN